MSVTTPAATVKTTTTTPRMGTLRDGVGKALLVFDPSELQQIPCAVCSHKANGFHYGAHTCAACKVPSIKVSIARYCN